MAFDFPASPTEGQLFTPPVAGAPDYIYHAPAWELLSATGSGAATSISDTPPVGPVHGQIWVESDSGSTYVFWNDGTSSQWVQINSPGLSEAPLDGLPYLRRSAAWVKLTGATAQTRNRIVNGAMQISQENGLTAAPYAASGVWYAADQWASRWSITGGLATAALAASVSPEGSRNMLGSYVSTAAVSLAAGDYHTLSHNIEGTRTADFQWGGSLAKQVILRFWAQATLAGTYTVSVSNNVANRTFLAPFTLVSNVWKLVTVIIPGDTTGTWLTDTGIGVRLEIVRACGTTYGGGVAGWQAGNKLAITGQMNGSGVAATGFNVADVGLYLDADSSGVAPKWEMPDEAQELAACMRYLQKMTTLIVDTNTASQSLLLPVTMRVAPAISASIGVTTGQNTGSNIHIYHTSRAYQNVNLVARM